MIDDKYNLHSKKQIRLSLPITHFFNLLL